MKVVFMTRGCVRNLFPLWVFVFLVQFFLVLTPAHSQTAASRYDRTKQLANQNTITIIGGGLEGTYMKLVDDIQVVLNDLDQNDMRIMAVVGSGAGQNVKDMLFWKGVDVSITERDHPQYFKRLDPVLYASIDKKIQYITELCTSEFHVVAGPDIKTMEDLKGKKVNFWNKLSATAISSETIFKELGIQVEPTYYDWETAVEKLKSGEISAIVRTAGAPIKGFSPLKMQEGFHFLAVDAESLPNRDFSGLLKLYYPAVLRHEDYPDLIPPGERVQTVADSAVLITYAWPENSERYRRVAKFVNKLFDNFDKLKKAGRHSKWTEVNLAAQIPGWVRFKPAQEWVDKHKPQGAAKSDVALKADFDKFLQAYVKLTKARALTETEKTIYWTAFLKWRAAKNLPDAQH